MLIADGVKGEVIANSESFVTWARRAADDAERRARGFDSLEGASVVVLRAAEAEDGVSVSWNCSRRARVEERRVGRLVAILKLGSVG